MCEFSVRVLPDEQGFKVMCPCGFPLFASDVASVYNAPVSSVTNLCFATNDPKKLFNIAQCVDASFKPCANNVIPVSLYVRNTYFIIYYMFREFGVVKKSTKIPEFVKQLQCFPACESYVRKNESKICQSLYVEARYWKVRHTFVALSDVKQCLQGFLKNTDIVDERLARIECMQALMKKYDLIE